jgi:hypothetical protein
VQRILRVTTRPLESTAEAIDEIRRPGQSAVPNTRASLERFC